jgi:hypothetical protein
MTWLSNGDRLHPDSRAPRPRWRVFSDCSPQQLKRSAALAAAVVLAACVGAAGCGPAAGQTKPGPGGNAVKPEVKIVQAEGQATAWKTDLPPLERTVDLNVGESRDVELCDGRKAHVKLVSMQEIRDSLRQAVRQARVKVEVNGQPTELISATYHLPVTVGGAQVDCPITKGYLVRGGNAWKLSGDARLRLWPAGGPWIEPGTLGCPVGQRWFASDTQMANEPTFVDGVETPGAGRVYYHYGLDFGGAEYLTDVLSAADGLVVTAGNAQLAGYDGTPVEPRYDTVYVMDRRGWYHRYSHLAALDDGVRPGALVKMGQRLGALGKEGDSGGWSHLHYQITTRQPSGQWGVQDGYAYAWQAYQEQHRPKLLAVARPHHFAWTGETVRLDGSKSWSAAGQIAKFEWTFTDGAGASGPQAERVYAKAGEYSEILRVTDTAGNVDYDFAVVQVIDKTKPEALPPALHVTYYPTFGTRAGDELTLKARCFGTTDGRETWDFGDGSPPATTKSDGCVEALAKDGYAAVKHCYAKPGHYLVTVRRSNKDGLEAVMRVHVRVGQ